MTWEGGKGMAPGLSSPFTNWHYWRDAIIRHNDSLGKGEASKRFIAAHDEKSAAAITASRLLAGAVEAKIALEARQGPLAKLFVRVIELLNRHSKSIDIFSQVEPWASAVVWGSVRAILEVLTDREEATIIAIRGIHKIVWDFVRWEDIANNLEQDERLGEAFVRLYTQVLDFLLWAVKHLRGGFLKGIGRSLCSTQRKKFASKLQGIEEASHVLDVELQTRACRDVGTITTSLDRISDTTLSGFNNLSDELAACRRQHSDAIYELTARHHSFQQYQMDSFRIFFDNAHRASNASRAPLEWLNKSNSRYGADDVREPVDGTTEWLASRPEFTELLSENNKKIFWLLGNPGCGKSVALRATAGKLQTGREPVLHYSFPGSLDPQLSNPSTYAALLLSHLLHDHDLPADPDGEHANILKELSVFSRLYETGPQRCPFKKLWDLCCRALALRHPVRTVLIIDALDECYFDGDSVAADFFVDELRRLSQGSLVRVALSARSNHPFSRPKNHDLQLRVSKELVSDDIMRVASARFEDLYISSDYKAKITQEVASRAQGCFLWVIMALVYLKQLFAQHTSSDTDEVVRQCLDTCPPGLYPIYDRMIQDADLDESEKALQWKLFALVTEARRPLYLDEIARSLRKDLNAKRAILRLGAPLLELNTDGRVTMMHNSVKNYVTRHDQPLDQQGPAISVPSEASHACLARACIMCLLAPEFGQRGRIGRYLHLNLSKVMASSTADETEPSDGITFEYAWEFWDIHLTAVLDPDRELLELLMKFLYAFQFVFWSEFASWRLDFTRIRLAEVRLQKWLRALPEAKKPFVNLDGYFVTVYRSISKVFEEYREEDKELPCFSLIQLGTYLITAGRGDEAIPVLEKVTEGLTALYGNRHPLTLRARTDRADLYLQKGRFGDASREYAEIVKVQRELGMEDDIQLYLTLQGRGGSEYFMTRYDDSILTLDEVSLEFLRLVGPDHHYYQGARLWYSFALIQKGDLAVAFEYLSRIFESRRKKYGDEDGFAVPHQFCMGDIQRQEGEQERSLRNLRAAFSTRQNSFQLSSIWLMDIGISLLVAYRDFGLREEALSMLGRLDREGNVSQSFARYCQVEHLRALLQLDDSCVNDAITALQTLLVNTDRHQYNRPVLWIMLDVARILRRRKKAGDEDQAMLNFDRILIDLTQHKSRRRSPNSGLLTGGIDNDGGDDDDDEPDPPRLLKLAEEALTLTRQRKFDQVSKLFEAEKVGWYRPEDLWLPYGGPAADTTWMKGPFDLANHLTSSHIQGREKIKEARDGGMKIRLP